MLKPAKDLRYLRCAGRGLCLGAGKPQSWKNACKSRTQSVPHVINARFVGRSSIVQNPLDNYGMLAVSWNIGIKAASVSHKRRSA
jgi:hypothetical protein